VSARVDPDAGLGAPPALAPNEAALGTQAIAFDPDDRSSGPALPNDHPRWMRDTLSISQRARALLVSIKPVVVRVIAYWEHRVKNLVIGGETLCVDGSGSYRLM
jgi:hypothetical protein